MISTKSIRDYSYSGEKIYKTLTNVIKLVNSNTCVNCIYYVPISDDRFPKYLYCSKLIEYLDFPNVLNEICYKTNENNDLECMSFVSKYNE